MNPLDIPPLRRAGWSPNVLGSVILGAILLAALLIGLYGRFVGLGLWPLGVDEFYSARSIENVLHTGLPRYACGGFYTRGLAYQYVVAIPRLLGASPELAGRLISALSSILALPAAFILGRRLHGKTLGIILVTVVAISVWEIEMARFARTYAAFQSLFLWYLVYFLRYTEDDDRSALIGMGTLSVVGVLLWEGGALIGLANLLPPFLKNPQARLRRHDWLYLTGMLILLAFLLAATKDWREGAAPIAAQAAAIGATNRNGSWPTLEAFLRQPAWPTLFALSLLFAAPAVSWLWGLRRRRWLTCLGLAVVLLSAAAHQFVLCAATLLLLRLTGLLVADEWRGRGRRSMLLALGACVLFWLIFAGVTRVWSVPAAGPSRLGLWLGPAEQLSGYPDLLDTVLRPWARTLPIESVMIVLLLITSIVMALRRTSNGRVARSLLTVLLVLLLGIGSQTGGRMETRYSFFLYPMILALGFAALFQLTQILGLRRASLVASFGSLLLFAGTEDFQPRHIAAIASPAVTFRIGMPPALADHYYPRANYRLVAGWLRHFVHPADVVAIGIPPIVQYYHRTNYFFLQGDDERYDVYACPDGRTERWTNLPLLYRTAALAPILAAGHRLILVMYPDQVPALLMTAQQHHWYEEMTWSAPGAGATAVVLRSPGRPSVRTAIAQPLDAH